MTEPDPRPEPRYGQYAPVAPVPPVQAPPEPVVQPAPHRSRDVVVTTVLLLIGVVDVVTTFPTFADLGPSLALVYEQLGIQGSPSTELAAPYGLAINVVRIVLLAITVVVSLLLIARRRRAFWVPLAGYALAGVVTTALMCALVLNDPAYLAWVTQHR